MVSSAPGSWSWPWIFRERHDLGRAPDTAAPNTCLRRPGLPHGAECQQVAADGRLQDCIAHVGGPPGRVAPQPEGAGGRACGWTMAAAL